MKKIKIVSTFSDQGYELYGKKFIEDCQRFISKGIEISLYVDNAPVPPTENIKVFNLSTTIPKTLEFKQKYKENESLTDYRYNAVKFCYKVYVMCHEAMSDVDYLIWLDADTRMVKDITPKYLLSFLPKNYFVSYLGRKGCPETGFLLFDLHNPYCKEFFDRFSWYYDSGEVFNLEQNHDGWVIDHVLKEFESPQKIQGHSITPKIPLKHPFNMAFEGYMMHLKGTMKVKIPKALKDEK